MSVTDTSVTEGNDEQADRSRSRYLGPPYSKNSRAGADAWLGDRTAHQANVERCSARRSKRSVSRAAQTGETGLDQVGVGCLGNESSSQVLFANAGRPQGP